MIDSPLTTAALTTSLPAMIVSSLFPEPTSTTAGEVDKLFYFILVLCIIFFAIIVAALGTFVFKYRHVDQQEVQPSPDHNNALELLWTGIPSILVALVFFWGFVAYLDMRKPPDNSYEIEVTARKWGWSFRYPNGHVDDNLHVPEDRP
ncbi:MAG: cytochrome c oxidase subunit II transmembrane domain-containing protein, partial [Planctomycetota bacterium]